MNTLIKITVFLFCGAFPLYACGMFLKSSPKKIALPQKLTQIKIHLTTYTELIAALKKETKVSTADFISCLNDAQSKNLRIYFISDNVSNDADFEKFFDYYEDSLDNPDAFKNENGTVFFDTRIIHGGFICANLNEEKPENNQAYVLTTESEYENGRNKALGLFNIPANIPEDSIKIIKKDELTEVLNALYTNIAHQIERIKNITEEKQPAEQVPFQEQQQEKQAAAIKQYEPILTHAATIATKGLIPKELETKAELLIQRITNGLAEPDDKETQKFFVDLENRVKKVKEDEQKLEKEKEQIELHKGILAAEKKKEEEIAEKEAQEKAEVLKKQQLDAENLATVKLAEKEEAQELAKKEVKEQIAQEPSMQLDVYTLPLTEGK